MRGLTQALDRIATAPTSWGLCEVPGWGVQLPPERVLPEMRELGFHATEAGPDGYLGSTADEIRAILDRYELELVGGFLPLVLHRRARVPMRSPRQRAWPSTSAPPVRRS